MDLASVSIIEFNMTTDAYKKISPQDFTISRDENIIYWIHINPNNLDALKKIEEQLLLPENVMQLCLEQKPIPVLIENTNSIAIQIECLLSEKYKRGDIEFSNLVFYLTPRFCLTVSTDPIPAITEFEENYPKYLKYAETPCFILFLILDNAINHFSKILFDFEFITDQIDLSIRETQDAVYAEVMRVKKQVMKMQHHIAAIRDILMRISGRRIPVISDACRASLINLLDHSRIIFNEAEAIRDNLRNTLDQIDNALMQKMSKTMKVLTAFAAVFLPLTVITGIYGMNFYWIPELHWKYGYFWALGLMLVVGCGLYIFFKRKKWF